MSTLLDVPLSEKEETPEAPPPPPSPRRALVWILLLAVPLALAVGWFAGYLWPRTSPPVISLSTTLADFAEQLGGEEGPPLTVDVHNDGQAPLDLESLEITGHHAEDFHIVQEGCTGVPVAGDGSCSIVLQFTPPPADEVTPAGDRRTASLRLRSNASNGFVSLPLVGVRVTPRLEAIPSSVDFGHRPLESPAETVAVQLTNQGSARVRLRRVSLEGEGAADFLVVSDACSSATLGPGESCRVRLTSTPRRPGESEAVLRIASDASDRPLSIPVSATAGFAEPTFEVRPESVDFGEVRPGADAPEQEVEIRNLGDEPLTVRRVAAEPAAGFSVTRDGCSAEPVPPGDSCGLAVDWTASGEGVAEGELVLVYTRPGKAEDGERRVPLAGRAVAPRLEVDPARLELGDTAVGQTGPTRAVNVENRGTAAVTLEAVELDGPGAGAFTVDEACSGRDLPPGRSCQVDVRFRPVREGAEEARLRVRPAGEGASPVTVSLRGTGVTGRPRAMPERLSFPEVRATRRADRRLTVTNVGRAPLRLGDARVDGPAAADFRIVGNECGGGALAPGDDCTLSLRFAPGDSGGRQRSAELRLEHDGAGPTPGELTVALTGTALPAPKPELAVAPSSVRFGEVAAGERSGIETVTVRNPGTARLNLEALRVDGPHAEDFRLVPATCDGTPFLAPGGDCTVGVRFTPTAAGDRRARLVVAGDARGSPRTVDLTGRGL